MDTTEPFQEIGTQPAALSQRSPFAQSAARRWFFLVLFLVFLGGGVWTWYLVNREDSPPPLPELGPILSPIRRADRVTLYEGLPHQTWERKELEEQLRTKETVKYHDFPFYRDTLPLKEEDAWHLTELCFDFRPGRYPPPEKMCGGFHPDYCIEWQAGDEVYRVLVCFGCRELKGYAPNGSLHVNLHDDNLKVFERILKNYRKNRPVKNQG